MIRQAFRMATLFKPRLLHSAPVAAIQIRGPLFQQYVPKQPFGTALPKHHKLAMPSLSPTMETGNILKYLKKVGDPITIGDVLCEVETDKASVGFEMQEEGFLAKIVIPEGSKNIKVGQLVAIVVPKQADIAAFANFTEGPTSQQPAQETPKPTQQTTTPPPQAASPTAAAGTSFPKHAKLGLPALSPTMEKGNLMKWLVKEGDKVNPGDTICEVETDKASVGFEIQEEGYIAKILVPAGTKDIALGTVLAIQTSKKENVAAFKDYSLAASSQQSAQPTQQAQGQPAQQQEQEIPIQTTNTRGQRIFASPLAREFAKQNNIPLDAIRGTGIEGSIVKRDVEKYLQTGGAQPVQQTVQTQRVETPTPTPPPPKPAAKVSKPIPIEGNPYSDVELTSMRQTIAHRLLESKTTIPHYYLTITVTMDKVLKVREELNKLQKVKISVNDFIIKASALALKDIPQVNSQWHGTFIRKFTNADISVAVATDSGLITPIVFNAGAKGLATIASQVKELADKAKNNKLKPQEFQGGTFTISNLGMFGIDQFVAVINPPQAAILAIGRTNKRIVPDEHGAPIVANQMDVTLSSDHRIVDGAVGAQWLQRFKFYIEDPHTLLL